MSKRKFHSAYAEIGTVAPDSCLPRLVFNTDYGNGEEDETCEVCSRIAVKCYGTMSAFEMLVLSF